MIIVLGDSSEYLSEYSKKLDENSYLVDMNNWNQEHTGIVYTSLGDLDKSTLVTLTFSAEKVIYYPPEQWSLEDTQKETEKLLFELIPYIKIENSDLIKDYSQNEFLTVESRKTDNPQLWCAGDSWVYGSGLDSPEERWVNLLSQESGLEFSLLSRPGASIPWASDQILRSDIRKNDIVVWGMTEVSRFPWYSKKATTHVNIFAWEKLKEMHKLVTLDYLDSDHHALNALRLILQVENFCEKIGAKLILVNFWGDIEFPLVRKCEVLDLRPSKSSSYPDEAKDGLHPGPKSNRIFAQKIFNVLTTL